MVQTIRKAIIPAAGLGTRLLPITESIPKEMLPVLSKPTIQYIVEEAVQSGIEEILVIISKHKYCIKKYLSSLEFDTNNNHKISIRFLIQKQQKGLGDAILCAKSFVAHEPFAILLGDIITQSKKETVLKQMINIFEDINCSIIATSPVDKDKMSQCGIIIPKNNSESKSYFEIENLIEKPKYNFKSSNLAIAGRYILTPKIFELLKNQRKGANDEIQLTDAIKRMLTYETVYGYLFEGNQYDVGNISEFVKTNIAFALDSESVKKEVLSYIKHLNDKK